MCSTIAIGAGKLAGRAFSSWVNAWGPPVEVPIRTTRSECSATGMGSACSDPRSRSRGTAAARSTLLTSSSAMLCKLATASALRNRERGQDAQTVQIRHHQIERDHVRLELGDFLQGVDAVTGNAHDFD